MQVNSINHSPNFEARIKIQKTGFQNIAKDLKDSTSISGNSSASTVSAIGEATIFPFEIVGGKGLAGKIRNSFKKMGEHFSNIFHRNIQTSVVENPENLKAFSKQSASATAGTTTVSSGVGAYASSVGSALDQSVHYPLDSIYTRDIPQYLAQHAPESVNKTLGTLADSAYDVLYNEHGLGNECASASSSISSSIGVGMQGLGSKVISESSKKMGEIVSKKIPS